MANTCDPRYPQPIQFYFITVDNRPFQWAAVDMESLLRDVTEKGLRIKEIRTLEEQQELEELMEMSKEFAKREEERELKESA